MNKKFTGINNITQPAFDASDKLIKTALQEDSTIQRFKKVYIDEIPQSVLDELASHFDDYNKTITLSVSELKEFALDNFQEYLNSVITGPGFMENIFSSLTYNGNSYTAGPNGLNSSMVWFTYNYSPSHLNFNKYYKASELTDIYTLDNKFHFDEDLEIEYDLELIVTNTYYSGIKQAILKDLLKNLGYILIDSSDTVNDKIATAVSSIQSGTKLYKHHIDLSGYYMDVITTDSTKYTVGYSIPGLVDNSLLTIVKQSGSNSVVYTGKPAVSSGDITINALSITPATTTLAVSIYRLTLKSDNTVSYSSVVDIPSTSFTDDVTPL